MALSRAKREKLKAAVNFMGASGSAKTFSSLLFAKGIIDGMFPDMEEADKWGKIGIIDTEHRRSLLYAEREKEGYYIGSFWHYPIEKDFSPKRYVQAIKELKEVNVEVIIIDSMSHAWNREGGILTKQQEFGGTFQDWAKVRPYEWELWQEIFERNDVHFITTMRTKQEYAMSPTDSGKWEVQKLGIKSIQNDQLEYEYMVNFRTEMNHKVWASKDNLGLYEHRGQFYITPEDGLALYNDIEQGIDMREKMEEDRKALVQFIHTLAEDSPIAKKELTLWEKKAKTSVDKMNYDQVRFVQRKMEDAVSNEESLE